MEDCTLKEYLRIIKEFTKDRDQFDKFAPYLLALKNTEREFKYTLQLLVSYYTKYPNAAHVDEADLKLFIKQNPRVAVLPNVVTYIESAYKVSDTNSALTMDTIEACLEKHVASNILDKVALVIDNNKAGVIHTIQDDIDEYLRLIRNPPKNTLKPYVLNLNSLINSSIKMGGLPFCLKTANDAIKGARPGTSGLIFAYVDTGKTSFGVANLISMHKANFNLYSCDRPILYCGNEESIAEVNLRAIQALTKRSDAEIEADEAGTSAILNKWDFTKGIHFIDNVKTMGSVERLLDKHNPRVMYIDQGTKVRIPNQKEVKDVSVLEEIFNVYRELGKQYGCAMIAMAQADSESHQLQWLTLRNLYGSKVAIQGELDWAISLGTVTDDIKYLNYRYINVCKNKKGPKPKFATIFDTLRCQFKEVK
jgi:hypothetical protein